MLISAVRRSDLRETSLPFLIGSMFILGLYAPTSFGGEFSSPLWGFYLAFAAVLLILLLLRKDGLTSYPLAGGSILMMAALFAATLLSPFPDYRWGGLLPYIPLSILFVVNIRDLSAGKRFPIILLIANLINVFLGIAAILQNERIGDFLVDHYSSAYSELVPFMMSAGKPVLTFGTHSVAALFYYMLFLMNFEAYKLYRNWSSLAFASSYVVLGFALRSVSGLLLMFFATLQLLRYGFRMRPKLTALSLFTVIVGAVSTLYYFVPDFEEWIAGSKLVWDILTSPVNGFMGRFTEIGTLYSTVHYIQFHPLSPVGVGFRSDLMFGDSGPVEYFLRGSVVLLAAVYVGLFFFLRKNLVSRAHSRLLFLVILAFETGYSSLIHFRALFLLPVLVIYLNDLSRETLDSRSFGSSNPVLLWGS